MQTHKEAYGLAPAYVLKLHKGNSEHEFPAYEIAKDAPSPYPGRGNNPKLYLSTFNFYRSKK